MTATRLSPAACEPLGAGLHRPECVLVGPDHSVYVPDWRGGVTRIGLDGTQETWLAAGRTDLRPNGIALQDDGSFLLANLGTAGGVWQLHRDGRVVPFLTEIDGQPVPPANFVVRDGERTWISVSTRHDPRTAAWRPDIADGFIVLADRSGARIVADGLRYTNEVRPDPAGQWLYAVETFGRQLTRFRMDADGSLTAPEAVATFGSGAFPDGFAFDRSGRIWITTLISNRLIRVTGGEADVVLSDENPEFIAAVDRAFDAREMRAEHLGPIPGTRLQQLTSVAFSADEREVYLGTLHGGCVYRLRL